MSDHQCSRSKYARRYTVIPRRMFPLLLAAVRCASCATSPTGQCPLRLFPDSEMAKMGVTAFEQTKKQTPHCTNTELVGYVQCVVTAVTKQAGATTQWEVQVFESPEVNAFALPGGKIGV